jgi:hypothetical protein
VAALPGAGPARGGLGVSGARHRRDRGPVVRAAGTRISRHRGRTLFLPRIDLDHPETARGDFAEFRRQAVDGCSLLFPNQYPVYLAEARAARSAQGRWDRVLGDSMTYGLGVQLDHAFPAALEARTPSLAHYNLAFPGRRSITTT